MPFEVHAFKIQRAMFPNQFHHGNAEILLVFIRNCKTEVCIGKSE